MHVVSWECGVVKLGGGVLSLKRVLLWPFSRATQTDKALTAFFLLQRVVVFGLRGEGRGVEGFETELCGLGAVLYRDREACG